MDLKILGIDCGSRVTGYGVISCDAGGRLALIDFGVIRTSTGDVMATRLHRIHSGIAAVIEQHGPQSAAFENVFHSANVQSALKLGHARGVSILAAAAAGIEVYEYSPLEVKGAVTGYGHADKSQVQQMVRSILRLRNDIEPFDASDALAVAICHAHSRRMKQLTGVPA